VYSFEKAGVLRNVDDASSVIPRITPATYAQLKADNVIFAGMLPKLDNAFAALQSGVQQVIIGQAEDLPALLNGRSGTTLAHA
jgi:acetylglutamate kinase